MKHDERPAHAWAAETGPGLATLAADNDPSGILTYSLAGAQFGFGLLWVCVLSYPSMVALQLIASRVAVVTGQGLTENMRTYYARWLFILAVARFLFANTLNLAADLLAMGEAARLIFHGSVALFIVVFAGLSLGLQWWVPYIRYARMVKWLTLALSGYGMTLLLTDVPWRVVVHDAFVPHVSWNEGFLAMLLAVIGTTVSPYLLFSQAEQEVEAQTNSAQTRRCERTPLSSDESAGWRRICRATLLRTLLSNAMGALILCACAVTLHTAQAPLDTAADAARGLSPFAHSYAPQILGFALLGTALLAAPLLAGSAAHAAASSFGWPRGEARDQRIAVTLAALMVFATSLALAFHAFGADTLKVCYWSALGNGMTVTPVLFLLVLLSGHREAVGAMKSHAFVRALSWLAVAATGASVAAHELLQFF
jgi:Mn2+/Fe2+ NRAMP family transporter